MSETNERNLNQAVLWVDNLPAELHLAGGGFEDLVEAGKVPVVDDAGVVGGVFEPCGVEGFENLGELGDEGRFEGAWDEEVVWRGAGLPRVDRFGPGDAFGSEGDVGRGGDDGGVFASAVRTPGGAKISISLYTDLGGGGHIQLENNGC